MNGKQGWVQRVGQGSAWTLVGLGFIVGVILIKPIAPVNSSLWDVTSKVNSEVTEMVGWTDLVEQVAAIYADIPEAERPGTAILAGNYGEAGALDLYGREYNLPPIISGSNSLWYRGYGQPEPETVILVGFESGYAHNFFNSCDWVGQVKNQYDVKNEESTRHNSLYVCRQPRRPWAELWPTMLWFQ